MSTTFNVQQIRSQFTGLARRHNGQPVAFFDGPGGSQVPQLVIDAVADCLANHNANDGGAFAASCEVGEICADARQAVADLLNVEDPDTIVFGLNMTTLTMALSRSLAKTWKRGDEIVVTRMDHDANVSPWVLAARDTDATVRFLEVTEDCRLRMDDLPGLLNERTKLVALGLASNAVGTINPVREIAEAAHQVGALVFVDAVHALPHMRVDVQGLDVDFLACSAYKFFGPHLGILWGRRELLESLSAYKVRPASDSIPTKWMTGTPSFEAIAGTLAAVDYLAQLGGGDDRRAALSLAYKNIKAHEQTLAQRFLVGIEQTKWLVWGIFDRAQLTERVATFGLTHPRVKPLQAAKALAEMGISVWAGNFYAIELIEALGLAPSGMLRVGFLHYNTVEEVSRLIQALHELGNS